jgi:hypothetical protein
LYVESCVDLCCMSVLFVLALHKHRNFLWRTCCIEIFLEKIFGLSDATCRTCARIPSHPAVAESVRSNMCQTHVSHVRQHPAALKSVTHEPKPTCRTCASHPAALKSVTHEPNPPRVARAPATRRRPSRLQVHMCERQLSQPSKSTRGTRGNERGKAREAPEAGVDAHALT